MGLFGMRHEFFNELLDFFGFYDLDLPDLEIDLDNGEQGIDLIIVRFIVVAGNPGKGNLFESLAFDQTAVLFIVCDDPFVENSYKEIVLAGIF
jgi:hypothetical protein